MLGGVDGDRLEAREKLSWLVVDVTLFAEEDWETWGDNLGVTKWRCAFAYDP